LLLILYNNNKNNIETFTNKNDTECMEKTSSCLYDESKNETENRTKCMEECKKYPDCEESACVTKCIDKKCSKWTSSKCDFTPFGNSIDSCTKVCLDIPGCSYNTCYDTCSNCKSEMNCPWYKKIINEQEIFIKQNTSKLIDPSVPLPPTIFVTVKDDHTAKVKLNPPFSIKSSNSTTEAATTEVDTTTEAATTEAATTEAATTEAATTEAATTEVDTTTEATTTTEAATTEVDTTEAATTEFEGFTTEGSTTEGSTTESTVPPEIDFNKLDVGINSFMYIVYKTQDKNSGTRIGTHYLSYDDKKEIKSYNENNDKNKRLPLIEFDIGDLDKNTFYNIAIRSYRDDDTISPLSNIFTILPNKEKKHSVPRLINETNNSNINTDIDIESKICNNE